MPFLEVYPASAMVKRWGKSPPGIMVTWYAARLMGCKAMYTGAWFESPPLETTTMSCSLIAGG